MFSYKVITAAILFSFLLSGCSEEESSLSGSDRSATPTKVSAENNQQALDILDISEREFGDLNAIALLFNTPLKTDQTFSSYISVEPVLPSPVLSEDGRTLYFTGINPVVEYQVEVLPGLEAVNGSSSITKHVKKVTTRALPSLVSFETDGAVMIPGKVDALPLIAVNIAEADVNVYKVKPDQLVSFFNEYSSISDSERWYYDETQLGKTVEHVYSSRLKMGSARNQRNRVSFPINLVPNINQGGVYLATVRSPGGFDFEATWFTVSSLGIQARDYGDVTRYITQDASSGKLLGGVQLNILDYNNKVITSGESDAEGAWETNNDWQRKSPRLILAQKDKFVSVLRYNVPTFDLSKFAVYGRAAKAIEHFVYSPRDIYRPGEEVILSSLTRDMDGQLSAGSITLELIKPDGESAGTWRIEPSAVGYYEFRHSLANNAPLGEWQAKVFSPVSPKLVSRFHFKVEEFLPERLRLVFNGNADTLMSFKPDDVIAVPVKGEYLYGAPAAGNRLDAQVSIKGWASPFSELKGYRFGKADNVQRDQFDLDSVSLGGEGEALTTIDKKQINWSVFDTPVQLRLGYSLFESGGRAINRNKSVLLWPRTSFVGVKPSFESDTSKADQTLSFDLVRVDSEGRRLAEGEVKATLYRLEEKYFWSHTPERGWHYQIEKNEYAVANQVLNFGTVESSSASLTLEMPVEWGRYRLELDDYLGQSKTVYPFQAGESWYNAWQGASDRIRPDVVTVALDKAHYNAGDQVNVKLVAPTEGTAIVLLETDRVLVSAEVELRGREGQVELTIPKDLARHDAYISAFVIAPTDQIEKVSKRSFGIAHLALDRTDRQLVVSIDVADKLLPESASEVLLSVTDKTGKPLNGDVYVTLSAVDSGVLSVTGYEQPDPFDFFYGRRRYQPSITDMYDDLAEPVLSDKAEVRWGGDGELERGGEAPPGDVQIVSLFQSPIRVEDGQAKVILDLPVFDGELTLNAVAMGANQFGKQTTTTKVASPVVAQLSMPRFMALGDEATLALDLANVSGLEQAVSMELSVSGALNETGSHYKVRLSDGQKQVVHFPVSAKDLGEGFITADITLEDANGQPLTLKREWQLGVRAAYPAVFNRVNKYLSKGNSFTFPAKQLASLAPESIAAQLRIATTPDLGAKKHFDTLMRYPYGCLEQTTSKSQPIAVLSKHKQYPAFAQTLSAQQKNKHVTAALSRYSELQRANGSFGLWDKRSPEEHWLTAYATDFLLQLNKSGADVPEDMLRKAQQRLSTYVHKRTAQTVNTWSDIPSHYEVSYKAYAAYVLAKEGRVTLGPLRDISERHLDDARGSLPGVHLGLAMIETGSVEEGRKVVEEALSVKRAQGYLGEYGSTIRDSALAIHSILNSDAAPQSLKELALEKVPDLLVEMKQVNWLSTQERAALLHLSSDLTLRDSDGDWAGLLRMAEEDELLSASGALGRDLSLIGAKKVSFTNSSSKPVFATYSWTGLPADMPEAVDEGIRLRVDNFTVSNREANGLSEGQILNIGDTVLTRVRFYSDHRIPDGLLVNLIPAGLELENQNLQHALKLDDIHIEGEKIKQHANMAFEGFKEDRYVAAIDIPAKREQTLYYISRAVTPGRYIVPPALAESMYKPSIRGLSNSIKTIVIMP